MKKVLYTCLLMLMTGSLQAHLITQTIEYKDGETVLEGYLAYDPHSSGTLPVVIVVHEWTGINAYTKKRCEQLAKMGYMAFAADMYGKGIRPQNPDEAAKEAAKYKNNRALMRQRILAALLHIKTLNRANINKVAAIGYCFGGTSVLELARSGAQISGVVSFHGGLDNPNPKDAKQIKTKVLVCHGAVDPFVPKKHVDAFLKEMDDAKVDYRFISYSNAVHSFTNPETGNDPSKGAAYNQEADQDSWEHMKQFLAKVFSQGS